VLTPQRLVRPLFGAAFADGDLLVGPDKGSIEHRARLLRIVDESDKHPALRPTRPPLSIVVDVAVPKTDATPPLLMIVPLTEPAESTRIVPPRSTAPLSVPDTSRMPPETVTEKADAPA
jgi:hypothetical protein